MIRALQFTNGNPIRTDIPVEQFPAALQDPNSLLWVDFEETPSETDEPILHEIFGFHPLAIDDALRETHVPKVDDWETFVYVVLQALKFDESSNDLLSLIELDVFLGKNYIVTHHDQKIEAVDHVWATCQTEERHLKYGSDHLLYRIADEVVGSYMPLIEHLDDEIDQTEDHIFEDPDASVIEHIFQLKRATIHLRRIIGPQREVLNRLARDDYAVIDDKARIYFRDVYDHLVRMHDITESMRDLVGGVLDTYLSVINNRMNDVMKTLTIITTLFMPISFVAGFFGMNFFQPVTASLVSWTTLPAFILMLAVVILVPGGMVWWVKRRKWM